MGLNFFERHFMHFGAIFWPWRTQDSYQSDTDQRCKALALAPACKLIWPGPKTRIDDGQMESTFNNAAAKQ